MPSAKGTEPAPRRIPECTFDVRQVRCDAKARAAVLRVRAGRGSTMRHSDPGHGVCANTVEKLLLAAPRGYCAGVDRAVQTVERALDLHGPPVYVRKQIVHNKHVVELLAERGAIFVEDIGEVPEGALTVFSAHGVSPKVRSDAKARNLDTIDATCPLVTKVHREAVKFAEEDYTIVLVGHDGHEEVQGTMGEAPEHIVLVENEQDVDELVVADPERAAVTPRPRSRSTKRLRSWRAYRNAFPRSPVRAPTTSATPPPTGRPRSSRWPAAAI